MSDLTKLQNGSDVRGIAMGENTNLTAQTAKKIAAAFGIFLKDLLGKESLTISVGRDSRLTGETLSSGVMAGLCQIGATVYNFNYASTPSMFMSILDDELSCDGAIMLTASHLPKERNGLKFFTREGGLNKSQISVILSIAQNLHLGEDLQFEATEFDFLSRYAQNLVEMIRSRTGEETPFAGTKILVDAGNGVGGFFADKILTPLGADTTGSVYLDPDGNFPNHIPNPELKDVMDGFSKLVLREKADLGIIFDTDVDRAALVDGNGAEINRNRLVALMSAIVVDQYPNTTIVTDSITSAGLTDYIKSIGGKHHRFKRGYKNVINEAVRLNGEDTHCALAIETSGHCAFISNYFLDDGAYMIVEALIKFAKLKKSGKSLSSLIAGLKEAKISEEIRVKIHDDDFLTYGNGVLKDFETLCSVTPGMNLEKPNYEGVRVAFEDGWCLLRMSLHDPVMPINYECDDGTFIRTFIFDFLEKYDKLEV